MNFAQQQQKAIFAEVSRSSEPDHTSIIFHIPKAELVQFFRPLIIVLALFATTARDSKIYSFRFSNMGFACD